MSLSSSNRCIEFLTVIWFVIQVGLMTALGSGIPIGKEVSEASAQSSKPYTGNF